MLNSGKADIVMGDDGDDTITLNGAIITGKIGGDTVPTAFNPSPGPSVGSDTADVSAAEYDGSQVLDGGDDSSVADGWIDTLTLLGLDLNVLGANIAN